MRSILLAIGAAAAITSFSGYTFAQTTSADNVKTLRSEMEQCLQQRDLQCVITKSSQLIQVFPKSGDLYFTRALAEINLGNNEAALSDIDRTLQHGFTPEMEGTVHRMRALALYNLKKYLDAIPEFDWLIAQEPKEPVHYIYRGWSNYYLKNYKAALPDFDKVLELKPGQTGLRRFRASANYNLGDYQKCVDDIDEELRINPNPISENYQIRANAYRKLGKTELAQADETRYAELQKAAAAKSADPKPAKPTETVPDTNKP